MESLSFYCFFIWRKFDTPNVNFYLLTEKNILKKLSSYNVGRNRTHLIFEKLYYKIFVHQICVNSLTAKLVEIIQVVSYKSFNVRPAYVSEKCDL